jgi:GTP-binding protein EngB required for normal cell division
LQQESKQNQVKKKIDDPATDNQVKTRENISLVLIDLPGYGFAYTSDERMHEWKDLMHHFLIERGRMLKRILLLIDARHGFKKADFDFLDSLQKSLLSDSQDDQEKQGNDPNQSPKTLPPIQVVLTKCDLVKQRDLARRVVQVRRQLSDSLLRESKGNLPVMLVCAKAGLGYNNIRGSRARGGILELQSEIASLAPRSKLIRSTKRSNK